MSHGLMSMVEEMTSTLGYMQGLGAAHLLPTVHCPCSGSDLP